MSTKARTAQNPLIGKFFHSLDAKGYIDCQGRVLSSPEPGWYLIETFDWIMGASYDTRLLELSDLKGWSFYNDAEEMRDSYEHGAAFCRRSPASKGIPEDESDFLLTATEQNKTYAK